MVSQSRNRLGAAQGLSLVLAAGHACAFDSELARDEGASRAVSEVSSRECASACAGVGSRIGKGKHAQVIRGSAGVPGRRQRK